MCLSLFLYGSSKWENSGKTLSKRAFSFHHLPPAEPGDGHSIGSQYTYKVSCKWKTRIEKTEFKIKISYLYTSSALCPISIKIRGRNYTIRIGTWLIALTTAGEQTQQCAVLQMSFLFQWTQRCRVMCRRKTFSHSLCLYEMKKLGGR